MTIIEQIKAEIDKLYGEYKDKFHQCGDQYHLGLIDGLDMAERVLDSLESEKPMQEGLEQEIIKCWQEWISPSNEQSVEGVLPLSEFAFYARHFAKWGAEHARED